MVEMMTRRVLSVLTIFIILVSACSMSLASRSATQEEYAMYDSAEPSQPPPPHIRILYPTEFANLSTTDQIRISWESGFGDDVRFSITMSRDGKAFDVEVATKLQTTEYVWAPPERPLVGWLKVKAFRNGYQVGEAVVPVSFVPPNAIIVSRADQKVYHLAAGNLMNVFICSTALPSYDIREGVYKVYRKTKRHWSKKWQVWMPYSLFFYEGYAIHATSVIRRLGHPASHGCIRLHPRDAEKLYSQVTLGMPVLMLPTSQKCAALETYFQQLASYKHSAARVQYLMNEPEPEPSAGTRAKPR